MSSTIISPLFADFIANPKDNDLFTSAADIEFKEKVISSLNKLHEMYLQFNTDGLKPETIFVLKQLPGALLLSLTPEAQPLYRNSIPRKKQYSNFSNLMVEQQGINGLSSVFHIQKGQDFKSNIFELTSAIDMIYEYVVNGQNNGSPQKFIDLLNVDPPVACLNDAIDKLLQIALTPAMAENMDAVSDLTDDICKMYKNYPPYSSDIFFNRWYQMYFLNPENFGFRRLQEKYPTLTINDFKFYINKYISKYVTQNPDNFTIDCSMVGGKKYNTRILTKKRRKNRLRQSTRKSNANLK